MKANNFDSSKEIFLKEIANEKDFNADHLEDYFTHLLCHKGEGSFRIANKVYRIHEGEIAILLPSVEIKDVEVQKGFKATCFFVSYNLLSKNNPDIGWGIKG